MKLSQNSTASTSFSPSVLSEDTSSRPNAPHPLVETSISEVELGAGKSQDAPPTYGRHSRGSGDVGTDPVRGPSLSAPPRTHYAKPHRRTLWARKRQLGTRKNSNDIADDEEQQQQQPQQIGVGTQRRKRSKFSLVSTWNRWTHSAYAPVKVLENTSSTARDHLASERTYLAYLRTSMGLAMLGVALVQLFDIAEITRPLSATSPSTPHKLQRLSRPMGALALVLSFLVLSQGTWRYFKIQFALFNNNFPIARISMTLQTLVFAGIIVVLFVGILADR